MWTRQWTHHKVHRKRQCWCATSSEWYPDGSPTCIYTLHLRLHKRSHGYLWLARYGMIFFMNRTCLWSLPGFFDRDKTLCLFDPQSHTSVTIIFCKSSLTSNFRSEKNSARRVYWDGGPKKLKAFIQHHLTEGGCKDNKFCNALELARFKIPDQLWILIVSYSFSFSAPILYFTIITI